MTTIPITIVEDTPEVREGLENLFGADDRFELQGVYASAEEALAGLGVAEAGARGASPPRRGVVLMDLGLPGIDGIEATRRLKAAFPEVQVMVLTVFEDDEKIYRSVRAGANGYLLKNTPPEGILEAVCELHAGGAPMSGRVARRVLDALRPEPAEPGMEPLTGRELEVVELLAEGLLYKEIADRLGISPHTVRSHVHHIYEKLQVTNRTEAVNRFRGRW